MVDAMERRQFSTAVKLLTGSSGEPGLLQVVKQDTKQFKDDGFIHSNSPDGLYATLAETTCEAYLEVCFGRLWDWILASISDRMQMNNHKQAQQYCAEALRLNPHSLHGLLAKAKQQLDADDFEPAIHTLKEAKEHHGGNTKIDQMMNEAQTLLRRSKQKDYYKVLGVTRDADEREIKKAYRSLTKTYHPDKAAMQGISKEEAEKKMASINEAYEVLSDPELKARFDRGDDPNDPHQGSPFQGSPFGQGAGGQQFFFQAPGKAHPDPPPIRKSTNAL